MLRRESGPAGRAYVKVRRLIPDSIAIRRPLPYAPVMRAVAFLITFMLSKPV